MKMLNKEFATHIFHNGKVVIITMYDINGRLELESYDIYENQIDVTHATRGFPDEWNKIAQKVKLAVEQENENLLHASPA